MPIAPNTPHRQLHLHTSSTPPVRSPHPHLSAALTSPPSSKRYTSSVRATHTITPPCPAFAPLFSPPSSPSPQRPIVPITIVSPRWAYSLVPRTINHPPPCTHSARRTSPASYHHPALLSFHPSSHRPSEPPPTSPPQIPSNKSFFVA